MSSRTRVLHVIGGRLSEGASRGAFWLHAALRHLGVDSHVLVQKGDDQPGVTSLGAGTLGGVRQGLVARLNAAKLRAETGYIFSDAWFGNRLERTQAYRSADLVHLHWVNHGMLSPEGIGRLRKPVVWTLRDMWPMTGGCHYSFECTAYQTRCGHCPALGSRARHDRSTLHQRRKQSSFRQSLHLVAISTWLRECAQRSTIFRGREIDVIHNGVDVGMFKEVDRAAARAALGLPANRRIVLTGAHFLEFRHKGMDLLAQAVQHVADDVLFVFFGKAPEGFLREFPREHRSLGYLADAASLNSAYSAADVFVAPSTFEAFGKTLIETMACGTPVVCFDACGPRDIVNHLRDGYKATPYEPRDLAKGVEWVLGQSPASALRAAARRTVEERFDIRMLARRYEALYERILRERGTQT